MDIHHIKRLLCIAGVALIGASATGCNNWTRHIGPDYGGRVAMSKAEALDIVRNVFPLQSYSHVVVKAIDESGITYEQDGRNFNGLSEQEAMKDLDHGVSLLYVRVRRTDCTLKFADVVSVDLQQVQHSTNGSLLFGEFVQENYVLLTLRDGLHFPDCGHWRGPCTARIPAARDPSSRGARSGSLRHYDDVASAFLALCPNTK